MNGNWFWFWMVVLVTVVLVIKALKSPERRRRVWDDRRLCRGCATPNPGMARFCRVCGRPLE